MTAAIYVRVSTVDQSHSMQTTELREYANRMGWEVIEYAEKASSVKKRPVFDRMMKDAHERRFDAVVVWKLDRFARSLKQLMECVMDLDAVGIRFVCLTQQIDTDKQNAVGRLMMQIMGAFAEFERSIIVERVRAGVQEAKRNGVHCGRHKRIFRRDEAVRLRADGMSFRKIAAQLGVPVTTVVDAIQSNLQ